MATERCSAHFSRRSTRKVCRNGHFCFRTLPDLVRAPVDAPLKQQSSSYSCVIFVIWNLKKRFYVRVVEKVKIISPKWLYYAAIPGRVTRYTSRLLSVCYVPTINSKTENHTMFKLRGEVIYVKNSLSMAEQFWERGAYRVGTDRSFLFTGINCQNYPYRHWAGYVRVRRRFPTAIEKCGICGYAGVYHRSHSSATLC